MSTVAEVLSAARARLPASEARLLLGHLLQQSPAWLMSHDDATLTETQLHHFASLVARRAGGEPVAYLLGVREFFGHDFRVAPGVLIPRPETELLVDIAKQKVGAGDTAKVLDLGTGSGCIAISIALARPQAQVVAVDKHSDALAIARGNAHQLGASVAILESDWFSALAGQQFDLIVSNPPYIADEDTHLAQGDLRHEPMTALASGADGLDALRIIIAAAPAHLNVGGSLWLEHGYDQADAVQRLLVEAGFKSIEQHRDLAGIIRVSGGVR